MRVVFVVLLLSCVALAQIPMGGVTSSGTSVVTDSCTGGLIFSWHMENVDVTLGGSAGGVNNGCSVGDTTATAVGVGTGISATQHEDGSNSATFPGSNRAYSFSVSSEDIVKHTAGTVDMWVYTTSFVSLSSVFWAQVDASNSLICYMRTNVTQQFQCTHSAGGTVRGGFTTIAGGFANNTWYHLIFKWDTTAHTGTFVSVCADTTTGTTNCASDTSALGTWAGTLTTMSFGDQNAGGASFFVDNAKVYSSWQ